MKIRALTALGLFVCFCNHVYADYDNQIQCHIRYGNGISDPIKGQLLTDDPSSDKATCYAALVINKRYLNDRFNVHVVAQNDASGTCSFTDVQIWDELKHSKSKFGLPDFSPTGAKRVGLMLIQDNNDIFQSVFLNCTIVDAV